MMRYTIGMKEVQGGQKNLSAEDLVSAIQCVTTLILDEDRAFDDISHLKKILTQYSVVFDDVRDHELIENLRTQLHHFKTMVYKDELTGVLNRRGIHEEFVSFFDEARFAGKNKQKRLGVTIDDFSILFIDLDDFKKVNDMFGHDTGDAVLKKISTLLEEKTRDIDAVGRFGGEEFVVAMLGATEDAAHTKAEEIRKHIEKNQCLQEKICVTASIGVASLHSSQAETLEQLITFADLAMYEAKNQRGKNNVVRYSELQK